MRSGPACPPRVHQRGRPVKAVIMNNTGDMSNLSRMSEQFKKGECQWGL